MTSVHDDVITVPTPTVTAWHDSLKRDVEKNAMYPEYIYMYILNINHIERVCGLPVLYNMGS